MYKAVRASFVTCFAVGALTAWSGSASAGPEATKQQVSRQSSPSVSTGDSAPEDRSAGPGSGNDVFDAEQSSLQARLNTKDKNKSWSITGGWETHLAVVQTEPDDGRTRGDKFYNFFFITPQLYLSPYDQLRADFGMYEHFVADPGESGLRLADISATYTRFVPLFTGHKGPNATPSLPPSKGVLLRLAASVTAPTSYASQEHGLITAPRLRAYLERSFLNDSLYLTLNGFGEYYVERYRSSEGGGDNALSRNAVQLTADYFVPKLPELSFGAIVGSSWIYYYGQQPLASSVTGGYVGDGTFTSQPVTQIYSAEIGASYQLPTLKGLRSTFSLTYAVGDNTVLHDGVQHLYFGFYRRSSELYATLTARY